MTGYNLPPGVTEGMIPGNRPEDEAWERYWDSDRPANVLAEMTEIDYDLLYQKYKAFRDAIDKDFDAWSSEPEECEPDE